MKKIAFNGDEIGKDFESLIDCEVNDHHRFIERQARNFAKEFQEKKRLEKEEKMIEQSMEVMANTVNDVFFQLKHQGENHLPVLKRNLDNVYQTIINQLALEQEFVEERNNFVSQFIEEYEKSRIAQQQQLSTPLKQQQTTIIEENVIINDNNNNNNVSSTDATEEQPQ